MNNNDKTTIYENIDTFSLILQNKDIHKLKNIILETPEIATNNNYHLLTLACWCSNYDIIDFLIQDSHYLKSALENSDFFENFQELQFFNSKNHSIISQRFNSLLLDYELTTNLPHHHFINLQKF